MTLCVADIRGTISVTLRYCPVEHGNLMFPGFHKTVHQVSTKKPPFRLVPLSALHDLLTVIFLGLQVLYKRTQCSSL